MFEELVKSIGRVLSGIGTFVVADITSATGIVVPSIVSLFVGVVGTYLGAKFTFRNLKNAQRRENALSELQGLRKALHLSIAITNHALGMKRQHIAELVSGFHRNREKIIKELGLPTNAKMFEAKYDFKFLGEVGFFSEEFLDSILAVDPGVNGAQEAMALKLSCETFNSLVRTRNELIEEIRGDKLNDFDMMRRYFGLYLAPDFRDDRFKDTIEGLGETLDDIVFFARDLSRRLALRLIDRRAEYRKLGRDLEVDIPVMFLNDQAKNLVPDSKGYEQWTKDPTILPRSRWEFKRRLDKGLRDAIRSDMTQEEIEALQTKRSQ